MIHAAFERQGDQITAVSVSGHAGYAQAGRDVVCAAVTSAVQLTANALTEVLQEKAQVGLEENLISIRLSEPFSPQATAFMQALYLHLGLLAEDYTKNLRLTVSEV
ncbi:ribosomal-processing cysteine protease Prp [Oscillospiraceae bacterium MB08-C2-2]|nr:ribosomal-processing cysteine protease Prp [Oscillospiraceae bacterium MB08-C2-2]